MNSGKDKASKFHSDLVGIIPFARINIGTRLIRGDDSQNLKIDVFEIEVVLNIIFTFKSRQ